MALEIDPYVLNLDKWLRRESEKWSQVIKRFTSEQFDEMHVGFVVEQGGTVDEKEIKNNKKQAAEKQKYSKSGANKDKIPSHEITLDFVKRGMNLNQIAAERGLKQETIVSHLEKIKEDEYFVKNKFKSAMKAFRPRAENIKEIKKAFKKKPEANLTAIYRALGGKYSFEELRVARLFI
jgi:uncharacterized protein YpbB